MHILHCPCSSPPASLYTSGTIDIAQVVIDNSHTGQSDYGGVIPGYNDYDTTNGASDPTINRTAAREVGALAVLMIRGVFAGRQALHRLACFVLLPLLLQGC